MSHHPVVRLTAPDGSRASIDTLLVPLIKALWNAGYETIGCCQDLGESAGRVSERSALIWKGYALLEFPIDDACRLLDAVKNTPQFEGRMHWAADGAWSVSIPVIAGYRDTVTVPGPWAQLRIPVDQIGDLVDVIREAG